MNVIEKNRVVEDVIGRKRMPVNRAERRVMEQHFAREDRRDRRYEAHVAKVARAETLKARAAEIRGDIDDEGVAA